MKFQPITINTFLLFIFVGIFTSFVRIWLNCVRSFGDYFLVVKLTLVAFWLIFHFLYHRLFIFFPASIPFVKDGLWLPETLFGVIYGFGQAFVLTLLVSSAFGDLLASGRHRRIPLYPRQKKALIKIPLEFYACDRITTLSEQLYSKTPANIYIFWISNVYL